MEQRLQNHKRQTQQNRVQNNVKTFSTAQDYNRGFGIIRHNIPKVAANNSFGILRNLTSDNKAMVFTKLLFVAGK